MTGGRRCLDVFRAIRQDPTWHDITGDLELGAFPNVRPRRKSVHMYVEEEGCMVWYFWNWISDFTRPRLTAATRKQSLLIFRTTESDHCVQGQAGQAATCDQAALAGVHTQHCSAHTSQNKNSVSVDSRQRSNSCQHYCHYRINYSIRYPSPVCLVMLQWRGKINMDQSMMYWYLLPSWLVCVSVSLGVVCTLARLLRQGHSCVAALSITLGHTNHSGEL